MRTRNSAVAVTLALIALTACTRTTVEPFIGVAPFTGASTYGAVPPESVVVYRTAAEIPTPYEQLAIVSARGDFALLTDEELVRSVRREAGRLGANGVLLADVTTPRGVRKVAGVLFGGRDAIRHGGAVAIRVRPDSTSQHREGESP